MSKQEGYIVPLPRPKHCNKCPFGMCCYSKPEWSKKEELFHIDGQINKPNTYGYVCNIEYHTGEKGYTKVMRAEFHKDIRKPRWCKLKKYIGERKE